MKVCVRKEDGGEWRVYAIISTSKILTNLNFLLMDLTIIRLIVFYNS